MRTREHALLMHRSHSSRAIIPPRRPPLAPADRLSMPSAGKRKATAPPAPADDEKLFDLGDPYGEVIAKTSDPWNVIDKFVLVPGTFWPDCSAAEQRKSWRCQIVGYVQVLPWSAGPAPSYVIDNGGYAYPNPSN